MDSSCSSLRRKPAAKSRYSEERKALFEAFPETLWILILNNLVEYPEALLALSNASLVLQDLQQNYNVLNCNLLSLVWPILSNHMICQTDFLKQKKFHQTVVLGCRKVCRSWCSAIDNFFISHLGHYPNADKHFQVSLDKALSDLPAVMQAFGLRTNFDPMPRSLMTVDDITNGPATKFLAHFCETHENIQTSPFVSGATVFRFHGHDFTDKQQNQIVKIYGKSILHCSLVVAGYIDRLYDKLAQLITQMPNLKSLQINRVYGYGWDANRNPVPTFPNLQRLTMGSVFDHRFVTDLLTKHCEILTHLEILCDIRMNGTVQPVACPNLKYFKVYISQETSVSLLDLAKTAHTVDVTFSELIDLQFSYIVRILEEKLNESCKTLILSLPSGPIKVKRQWERLYLKRVERLKLKLKNYVPIDFVLGMKDSLKVLHVVLPERSCNRQDIWKSMWNTSSLRKKEEIKFLDCLNKMENSYLWDMLPKLTVFRLDMWDGKIAEHWERNNGNIVKHVWQDNVVEQGD